jgi:hypothetical protein
MSAAALAPLGGIALGLLGLALVLGLTGTYLVPESQAVLIQPAGARLAHLWSRLSGGGEVDIPAEVVRDPGLHWAPPFPLAERHAVTLEPQRLLLRGRFRQSSAETIDMVEVEVRFRIVDVQRWAQLDADGHGADHLAAQLSSVLESVIQRSRQEARQALAQQSPQGTTDQAQLAARADQLVESRMDEVTRLFVSAVSSSDAVREAGIQVGADSRSRIVRGVPVGQANAIMGG